MTNMFRVRSGTKPVVMRALIGVASIALVAGCGGNSNTSSGNGGGGVSSITVGTVPAVSGAIIGYAADKGYFSKHNLNVKTMDLNGGAAAVPALQATRSRLLSPTCCR